MPGRSRRAGPGRSPPGRRRPRRSTGCGSRRSRRRARRRRSAPGPARRPAARGHSALARRLRVVAGLVLGVAGRRRRGRHGRRGRGSSVSSLGVRSPRRARGARPVGCPARPRARAPRSSPPPPASTTSATMAVMLSMPPSARAVVDQLRPAACSRSGTGSAVGDLGVVDQPADAVAAEQHPVAGLQLARWSGRGRWPAGR